MRDVTDAELDTIVGNFLPLDRALFRVLLSASGHDLGGDIAELGVMYGMSAALLGGYLSEGETLTVIDLFESGASDPANAAENSASYPGLTRAAFEANYLRFHPSLPQVITGLSEAIVEHAAHSAHRFVHVDASHLYDHVRADIANARVLLKGDGILVLDDFREEHTPGVAAAAWQAVPAQGLRPFLLSRHKLYATWGDPAPWIAAIREWLPGTSYEHEVQRINGLDVLRLFTPRAAQAGRHPWKRLFPEVAWPALAAVRATVGRLTGRV